MINYIGFFVYTCLFVDFFFFFGFQYKIVENNEK